MLILKLYDCSLYEEGLQYNFGTDLSTDETDPLALNMTYDEKTCTSVLNIIDDIHVDETGPYTDEEKSTDSSCDSESSSDDETPCVLMPQ